MSYKFTPPPVLSNKKLDDFISNVKLDVKKEEIVQVHLRMPESLWQDIKEISCRTGLSLNAVCLSSLQQEIKKKLKDLRPE